MDKVKDYAHKAFVIGSYGAILYLIVSKALYKILFQNFRFFMPRFKMGAFVHVSGKVFRNIFCHTVCKVKCLFLHP